MTTRKQNLRESCGLKVFKLQPVFDHISNAVGEAAMKMQVASRFIFTSTKGANSTVGRTCMLQTISRPHAVLNDEPREVNSGWSELPRDGVGSGIHEGYPRGE